MNGTGAGAGSVTDDGGKFLSSKSPVPLLSEPDEDWNGCVFARYSNNGFDDDADHLLGPVYVNGMEQTRLAADQSGKRGELSLPLARRDARSSNREERPSTQAINELTTRRPGHDQHIPRAWRGPGGCLSPSEPFNDADPFPKGNHQRAIVLLTDGENYGAVGDGYDGEFGTSRIGRSGRNERPPSCHRQQASRPKASRSTPSSSIHNSDELAGLMKDVATEPNEPYYYFAPDGDALKAAFQEIANHLSELRLSK